MTSGLRARARIRLGLASITIPFVLSCTLMPTAPRVPITVEGRISGPSGEPLAGTHLSFLSVGPIDTGWENASTDSLGRYVVQLFSGEYFVSVYPPAGLATPEHRALVEFSGSRRRYDFDFQGFRVTGRIIAPSAAPIDSGYIAAYRYDPPHGNAYAPLRSGSYSLLLPAGVYSLHARDANSYSGLPARYVGGVPITADTTIDIDFTGIEVSGHVSGPEGLPMDSVRVRAEYVVQNYTKPDGSYRLYVPTGTYRIWFLPPHAYILPRVTAPMTVSAPVTIESDFSGVEWTGTVRRLGTGVPLPEVHLFVRQVGDEVGRGASAVSGAQGEFRFILERDRSYDLQTYTPGSGWTTRLQGVAATADTTLEILVP